MSWLVDQLVSWLVDQLVSWWVDELVSWWVDELVSWWIGELVGLWIIQFVSWCVRKSLGSRELISRWVDLCCTSYMRGAFILALQHKENKLLSIYRDFKGLANFCIKSCRKSSLSSSLWWWGYGRYGTLYFPNQLFHSLRCAHAKLLNLRVIGGFYGFGVDKINGCCRGGVSQ